MKDKDFVYPSGKDYDAILKHSHNIDDIPFYINQANRYNSLTVLELGCGTGRIAIPLKETGLSIVGIDIMTLMLEEARKKAIEMNLQIPFIQGNIRNFDITQKFGKFDLILGPQLCFKRY